MTECRYCRKPIDGSGDSETLAFCDDACVFQYAGQLDMTKPPIRDLPLPAGFAGPTAREYIQMLRSMFPTVVIDPSVPRGTVRWRSDGRSGEITVSDTEPPTPGA